MSFYIKIESDIYEKQKIKEEIYFALAKIKQKLYNYVVSEICL